MYLRNSWYVAAWTAELSSKPLARTILEEKIVLFRGSDGAIGALEDRCPHRHVPLSMGRCDEAGIRCGYHGLLFNADGRCIEAPSQSFIPPAARVKAFPVTERYGWVWIWMGDPVAADDSMIPDFGLLTSPKHAAVGKTSHVEASYQLIIDNLMDLSHVGYVHTSTIGNSAFGGKAQLKVQRTENGVNATRLVADIPQPPLYVKAGVLPEGKNIDRWSSMTYVAPAFIIIHTGGAEAGTGALEGQYDHGLNLWVMNAMTPETATTTNYFWASVRAHALGNFEADELFLNGVSEAFEEDRAVLEAEQQVINRRGDSWSLALKADAASIEARRVLERAIQEEEAVALQRSPAVAA